MQCTELRIARIGNSRGVRIPAEVLRRYAFDDTAVMVESVDGILLRPKQQAEAKLSWADTAKAMAEASEDWSDLDATMSDGLDDIPWEKANVTETRNACKSRPSKSQRKRL